jgi:ferritin-like metal-binding protein YciE
MALRLTSFENLFLEQLQEIYSAEHQLISALPRFAEAAHSEVLKERLCQHQRQAKEHIAHLERIFAARGEKLRGRKSLGMAGILQEGLALIEKEHSPDVRDAALLDIVRKAAYYEMACFRVVYGYSQSLSSKEEARAVRKGFLNKNRVYRHWIEGVGLPAGQPGNQ